MLPDESAGKAVERLANKRRLRHQEALHVYEEKVAEIHQSLEENLFSLSSEFSISSESMDVELRRLFAAFADDDFALACYQGEGTAESQEEKGQYALPTSLTSLLNYLNKLCEDRVASLQSFEDNLLAIEERRKALVREQLTETARHLISIAHLLPEEIEIKFIGNDTQIFISS